uniref:Monocarboxylate transporter 12 n=1 Tax=Magallana gigas TaxID=29159 RepID=K1PGQ0_MAGGI
MTSNPTSSNHPVDKGWAWVILAGSSLIFMIYVGTLKTSGLFFVAFQDYYKSEAFTTSIIPGILQIVYSIASLPILTVGLDHLSARQMIIIGGFLGSIAYFIGFFADRIEILIFTHGVLYGIGCATIHGPTAYLIGLYFNRRRELANSVLVASSGFGGLVVPPLYRYLLDVYGLRGTMLIFSGVILHVVALAGLLKPPSLFHHPSNSNEKSKPEYSNVEIPDTHGQFVTGATLALCSFYGSFWSFIALAVMFGLFAGAIFSMTPSIVVDFVGIENFRTAFGILILGQGITMGTGAPLLGYLRDVSLSYIPSFYFMGACLILSGLTLLMEPCVRKRQDKMEVETRPSEEVALST